MREIRLYGSEGGGAVRSPYPYQIAGEELPNKEEVILTMRVFFLLWLSCQCVCVAIAGPVVFKPAPGKIAVEIDGKLFTNFYYGWKTANPFLHPLKTSTGLAVTRAFPVEKIEGESSDHIWQHGLWYSHGDINGVDFWERRLGTQRRTASFRCQWDA